MVSTLETDVLYRGSMRERARKEKGKALEALFAPGHYFAMFWETGWFDQVRV